MFRYLPNRNPLFPNALRIFLLVDSVQHTSNFLQGDLAHVAIHPEGFPDATDETEVDRIVRIWYIYIPGTQMTLVFVGKDLVFWGLTFKNRGHWGSRYKSVCIC